MRFKPLKPLCLILSLSKDEARNFTFFSDLHIVAAESAPALIRGLPNVWAALGKIPDSRKRLSG